MVGRLDPVVAQMALAAEGFAAGGTLYRETMHRAFAARLAWTLAPAPSESVVIDDARLRRAVDWIHDHLASDLSLEGMANVAAMSPAHFARAFKAATGASPLRYVIGARQDLAQVLLKTTRIPVAEVAFRVGYNDVSRFGQHFRRRTARRPRRSATAETCPECAESHSPRVVPRCRATSARAIFVSNSHAERSAARGDRR